MSKRYTRAENQAFVTNMLLVMLVFILGLPIWFLVAAGFVKAWYLVRDFIIESEFWMSLKRWSIMISNSEWYQTLIELIHGS